MLWAGSWMCWQFHTSLTHLRQQTRDYPPFSLREVTLLFLGKTHTLVLTRTTEGFPTLLSCAWKNSAPVTRFQMVNRIFFYFLDWLIIYWAQSYNKELAFTQVYFTRGLPKSMTYALWWSVLKNCIPKHTYTHIACKCPVHVMFF